MKKFLALLLFPAVLLFAPPPIGDVRLEWSYPPSELSSNLTFRVYSATVLIPGVTTNFTVITNVSGLSTSAVVRIVPGEAYFMVTSSNLWGESDFSNVAGVPPLPRGDVNLRIIGVN